MCACLLAKDLTQFFMLCFMCACWQEADAAKAAGKHDINMGRLPILEVDGVQIAQSKTIERFLAKKCGEGPL